MSKLQLIAIDPGKYATKAITYNSDGEEKKTIFRTKMDITDEDKVSYSKTAVVEFGGEKYMVGDAAETEDYDSTKTKLIHKLATYMAISKLIENNGDTIDIIVGCPLSMFSNKQTRVEYQEFIKDTGNISLKINGEQFNFKLNNVIAAPEGSGILMKKRNEYQNKLVGVIDIGGLNTNCCVYGNLAPIPSTIFTNNLGGNILKIELKDHLNSQLVDVNIRDFQMDHIISQGYVTGFEQESEELINGFFYKHLDVILREAKKQQWDLQTMDILFVGGGSILLKSQISNILPNAEISNTAQWDNVEGFYVMGRLSIG